MFHQLALSTMALLGWAGGRGDGADAEEVTAASSSAPSLYPR
jgi:hypothetical protein